MTISSTWYNKTSKRAEEWELHFKVARRGTIRSNRRNLAKRGVRIFQQRVYNLVKRWMPKRKVKVSFEREEILPEGRSESVIQVEARSINYVGKRWSATQLPSRVLSYAKKPRRKK